MAPILDTPTVHVRCERCAEVHPMDMTHTCPAWVVKLDELRAATVAAVNNLSERVGRLEHKVCGDRR